MFSNEELLGFIQTFSGPKRVWVHAHMQSDLYSLLCPVMLLSNIDPVFNGLIGKQPWWVCGVSPWVLACCAGISLFCEELSKNMHGYEIYLVQDVIRLQVFFQGIADTNKFCKKIALEFYKQLVKDSIDGRFCDDEHVNQIVNLWGERLTFNFAAGIQEMNNRGYDYFADDIAESTLMSSLVNFEPSVS